MKSINKKVTQHNPKITAERLLIAEEGFALFFALAEAQDKHIKRMKDSRGRLVQAIREERKRRMKLESALAHIDVLGRRI